MKKVRETQIPEQSNKPIHFLNGRAHDAGFSSNWLDEIEDEKKHLRKVLLNFLDFEKIINVTSIKSISKNKRFIENPRAKWEFGIVVNKDIVTKSNQNIEAWYNTKEQRDERLADLLQALEELDYSVISV